MPISKALDRKTRSEVNKVMFRWNRRVERARRLYGYVIDAASLDDEGKPPESWKSEPNYRERLRIARDARESKRNVPAYIEHLGRIIENADKMAAAQPQLTQLNIGTINLVQAPSYEAIDVQAVPVLEPKK